MHDKGHLTTMVDLEMYVENDKKDPLTLWELVSKYQFFLGGGVR